MKLATVVTQLLITTINIVASTDHSDHEHDFAIYSDEMDPFDDTSYVYRPLLPDDHDDFIQDAQCTCKEFQITLQRMIMELNRLIFEFENSLQQDGANKIENLTVAITVLDERLKQQMVNLHKFPENIISFIQHTTTFEESKTVLLQEVGVINGKIRMIRDDFASKTYANRAYMSKIHDWRTRSMRLLSTQSSGFCTSVFESHGPGCTAIEINELVKEIDKLMQQLDTIIYSSDSVQLFNRTASCQELVDKFASDLSDARRLVENTQDRILSVHEVQTDSVTHEIKQLVSHSVNMHDVD